MKNGIPEVLGKLFLDIFHVPEEAEPSRVFGGVLGCVILDSFIGEVEFLTHCCYSLPMV